MPMIPTKFPVSHSQRSCPWLVFNHGEKEGYSTQTFFDVAHDRYDVATIPEMCNKLICTCSHGWLVLLDLETFDCFLLNPMSMEKIMLPSQTPSLPFTTCILSSPPTDPDCVVIFLRDTVPSVIFLRLGESEWTEQNLGSPTNSFRKATVCGGNIYGLNFLGSLLMVKVVGSNLVVTQLDAKELLRETIPEAHKFSTNLIESCGELFAVIKYYQGATCKIRDIDIYKMDFSRLEWEKVESLGNQAFFLSGTTCNFSCSSTAPELGIKENCIYFTESNDRDLYIFNMKNYSISYSTPCPVKSNWLQPIWVMPAAL